MTNTRIITQAAICVLWLLLGSTISLAQSNDGISEFTTSNGLKVIHQRVLGNEVIAVRFYFKGGVRNITAKNAGIETLMLEVAQSGTKSFSKSKINRELARMGTIIESAGDYDYSIVAMRCVRQHFDRSWQILTDIVLNPLFEEKEVKLVREQLLNALRQENDDPDSMVSAASDRLLFASHPYVNRPIGTIESVGKLTAGDLRAYYARHLTASRLLLVVVGNVTFDNVKRKARAGFGKIPRGEYNPEPPPAFDRASTPDFELFERAIPTSYIRGTFAAPPLNHQDYAAMAIAMNILQQFFFQEVRVKRNLSYGADAMLLAQGANSGFIYVTTPKPNETIQVMFDQIEFLQHQIILEAGLRTIVSGFLTNYYLKLETNDAQTARLAEYELLGDGWRQSLDWIDKVRKVTPEDIQRVANTYLKNFHFAAVGQASQFDRTLFTSH